MASKAPELSVNSREHFQAIIPGTSQRVAIGGVSTQSSAFGSLTSIIRVLPTQDCHIKLGSNPTAVANGTSIFLVAAGEYYFGVTGGHKLAVIQDSAGGFIYITEGSEKDA